MLHQIGLHSADDLFASIPEELRLTRALDTPAALSEIELLAGFERMAAKNTASRTSKLSGRRRLLTLHSHDRRSHHFHAPSFSPLTRLINQRYRRALCR